MNKKIVDNINSCVGEEDILICLGDWSFGGNNTPKEFKDKILCKNIAIVYGNHDNPHVLNKLGFIWTGHYLEIRNDDQSFILSHYPICSWNGIKRGSIHLFGHCHLRSKDKIREGKSMDVGIDGNGYMPYRLSEIKYILKDQPIKSITIPESIDHHK